MSDRHTDHSNNAQNRLSPPEDEQLAEAFAQLHRDTHGAPPWLASRIMANLPANLPTKVAWYDWLFAHPLRWSSMTACSLLLGLGLGMSGAQSDSSLDNEALLFADTLPMDQWEISFEP